MRRKFLNASITDRQAGSVSQFWARGTRVAIASAKLAAVLLPVASSIALANARLDRRYALETVGHLRAWDNVDGLFASYVSEALSEYFAQDTRFKLRDISKADSILAESKLAYRKLIDDPAILEQIARSLRVETVVRTKAYKEGPRYRFVLDWLHAPKMDILAEHSFTIDEDGSDTALRTDELRKRIIEGAAALVSKLPFVAHVTGRDREWVTVNIGGTSNLRKGDELVIETLEEVKRHPITRAIVEWRIVPTGRLSVDEIDEGIAFCKVLSEEPGRSISRFQKVTKIIPAPSPEAGQGAADAEMQEAPVLEPPALGWMAGNFLLGNVARDYSTGSAQASNAPILFGLQAEGELWITRNIFAHANIGYGLFSGGGQFKLQTSLGYKYMPKGGIFGPQGWLMLGLRSNSFTFPNSEADMTGPTRFSGLALGVGGDLPVRDRYGIRLSLDIGLLTSATATGYTDADAESATDVGFYLGGYYRWDERMTFRAGFDVTASSADFSDGSVVNHRVINFVPSVIFYF